MVGSHRSAPERLQGAGSDAERLARAGQRSAGWLVVRTYFFPGTLWESGLLISADNEFFAALYASHGFTQRIFDLLQHATEDLCHDVVWEPLKLVLAEQLHLANRELKLSGSQPGAPHYSWACKRPELAKQLSAYGLSPSQISFVPGQAEPAGPSPSATSPTPFPQALDDLRRHFRRQARHFRTSEFTLEQIAEKYYWFLGAGKDGILLRLARIRQMILKQQPSRGKQEPRKGPNRLFPVQGPPQ